MKGPSCGGTPEYPAMVNCKGHEEPARVYVRGLCETRRFQEGMDPPIPGEQEQFCKHGEIEAEWFLWTGLESLESIDRNLVLWFRFGQRGW